jgi:tryptophanyl-tRNA synthetase
MAADILLYDCKYIPVGDDQKQHVELTRDIANRMNNKYGNVFTVPEPIMNKVGSRIMSLSNPLKKMSKSDDPNDKGCIYLLDDLNVARKKIMSAVTDSDMLVKYDEVNKPGISNLIEIYCSLKNVSIEECENEFVGANYGTFKKAVADVVCQTLEDIQTKYKEVINTGKLEEIFTEGANKARMIARKKLFKVQSKIGLM